ncbi:UNVERIFIED_CONTAM: hypothetical protein K2H54_047520 [Gekko kuhli]
MGSARVYGFLAASFLVLTLLANSTAACYCLGQNIGLQTIYCVSDVVAVGKFVNATLGDPVWYWARYDFETTTVFKIPKTLGKVHSLYTQLLGSTCGYRHNGPFNNDEYIITGNLIQNRVIIDLCSFIKPWDQVTRAQQRGLMMVYERRCK